MDKSSKKDKNTVNVKTEVVNKIKTSKVKLLVEEFEKNMEGASKTEIGVVDKDSFATKKDVFKVLMDSSRRLGDMTPSPRRKHPKKKMIGKLNNLEKFDKN